MTTHAFWIALLSAALFGAATPASKWLLAEFGALELAGLLYLGAALGSAPFALRRGVRAALPRSREAWQRLLGATLLGGALGPVLLLAGLARADAASVSLWLGLECAFTAILGALWFRDPLHRAGWLGAAGALGASALLSAGGGAASAVAIAYVAGACLCWALDNHWTALQQEISPAAITFWKGAAAGVANLALGLALAPGTAETAGFASVAAALAVGAICYGASIALYIAAAHELGGTRAQLLFASSPFFGAALSVAVLGEAFSAREGTAAALMALSLALVVARRHAHPHSHEALAHTHSHRHDDGHHAHAHAEPSAALLHAHWHEHLPGSHAHAHFSDLHHRHAHDKTQA